MLRMILSTCAYMILRLLSERSKIISFVLECEENDCIIYGHMRPVVSLIKIIVHANCGDD